MADNRFNRWQGIAINQLSVAVALISGLSISALALGFSLLKDKEFNPCGAYKVMFMYSLPMLLLAALFGCLVVISRTLDFRLTASDTRKKQQGNGSLPTKIFKLDSSAYGSITWFLFWCSLILLLAGIFALFFSIWNTYI